MVTATLISLLRGRGAIMRLTLAVAVACLTLGGLAAAGDAAAAIRKQTDIPAEGLAPALNALAKDRNFQIVYVTEEIANVRTEGAIGEFTTEEALKKLLTGTGLTYRYLDEKTVTVGSAQMSRESGGSATKIPSSESPNDANANQEGKKSSSGSFRVAQVDQGKSSSPSSIGEQSSTSQDNSKSAPSGLAEIIVTAQKREERLIDVPLAVTAVTGQDIESRGITDLQDMQGAIPGLTIADTGIGLTRLQLDGIAESNGGASGLPVVAVYLDEMPLNEFGSFQPDVRLLDMQRVEVLHGPQPTLYGDGAMGGTIHYVTASPDLNKFTGYADGWWGSVAGGSDSYRGIAVLNAPIIDGKLGLRIAASYERDGGWIDSIPTGQKDINDHEIATVRAKMLFQPSDGVSVSLLLQHQKADQADQDFGNQDGQTALFPSPSSQTIDLGNLIVTDNLGPVTLLSSTGVLHNVTNSYDDITSYLHPFLAFFYPPAVASTIQQIGLLADRDDRVFTEEMRLSSNSSGPFNYLVGAYYRYYTVDSTGGFPTVPVVQPPLSDTGGSALDRSWATFAEVRYAVTDRFQILGGLRHFEDNQSSTTSNTGLLSPPGPQPPSGTFVSNSPRLNLSYKISTDALIYANAAKGFRSGGTNGAPNNGHPTFGPETLWTYTLGTKEEWFEHRLSTDLSVYYNHWTNMQTVGFQNGSPTEYTGNGGAASGPGVDFSLMVKPLPDLLLSGTVGYSDMHHDTTTTDAHVGDPVDLVAKWTASASVDYRRPITSLSKLISRVDYQYSSGYFLVVRNSAPGIWQTPSRSVLNARIGAQISDFEVYLVGSNLANNHNPLYPALGAFIEPVLPTPRTLGIEVKWSF
jgi:iron complex outermembrane receptor protein